MHVNFIFLRVCFARFVENEWLFFLFLKMTASVYFLYIQMVIGAMNDFKCHMNQFCLAYLRHNDWFYF